LKGLGPKLGVFDPDLIDHVDADHLVAPAERQDLCEAGIEPHALEHDVKGDRVP
jgi:hypothetical protein